MRISIPQDQLGGWAVCPYALAALEQIQIVQTDLHLIRPPTEDFEVCVFVVDAAVTEDQLRTQCVVLNQQYPEMIFLPDHQDRATNTNGVATNNGKHNVILCQPKIKLQQARYKLMKTNYYSFWNKEYLKEILDDDYLD